MNPSPWRALMSTPAWDIFMWAETILAVGFFFECVVMKRTARGTPQRYLATGVVRTLGLPLAAACLFRFAVDILALDLRTPLDISGLFAAFSALDLRALPDTSGT